LINNRFDPIHEILDYLFLDDKRTEPKKVATMRDGQLAKMSLKELTTLQTRVAQAIAEKRIEERSEVRAKMEELARASGFSVAELFGSKGGKRGKVAPKYRNPKDPSQTWTGRGRRPTWMVEAGGNIERFLIS
jgi:DNA-binding protein H-NS